MYIDIDGDIYTWLAHAAGSSRSASLYLRAQANCLLSSDHGTYKTVQAIFWPILLGKKRARAPLACTCSTYIFLINLDIFLIYHLFS